jgi:iron complex transport system substrate-binding protein
LRIVSLIASATEIVHALELTPYQVGRSHECDYPDEIRCLPVCTAPAIAVDGSSAEIDALVRERVASAISVYEVSTSVLESLRPSHVVTQTHCRVCAVSLDDVERALADSVSSRPKLVSLEPNSLHDIWSDIRRVADACGVAERGDRLVGELQSRIERISAACRRAKRRPRVACIEWLEPLMASGNWVPELIDLANGENLFGKAGGHSPYMTWDQLLASDPDVVIVTPCGFDLERAEKEMYWLTDRPDWMELRAARKDQVYLIDGNQYMNRPGPRVVESLEIIAEILHTDRVASDQTRSFWTTFPATSVSRKSRPM